MAGQYGPDVGAGVLGGYSAAFAVGATIGALGASPVERFGLWRVAILTMAGWGACLIPFGFVRSVIVGFASLAVGGPLVAPLGPSPTLLLSGLATVAAAGVAALALMFHRS